MKTLVDIERSFFVGSKVVQPGTPFAIEDDIAENLLKRYPTLSEIEADIEDAEAKVTEMHAAYGRPHEDAHRHLLDAARGEDVQTPSEDTASDPGAADESQNASAGIPVKKGGGWYEFEGVSYRKADLIAAGVMVEE